MTANIVSQYGARGHNARELNGEYGRNLAKAFLVSVGVHIVVIGLYLLTRSVATIGPTALPPIKPPLWEVQREKPARPAAPAACGASAAPSAPHLSFDQSRYLRPIDSVAVDSTLRNHDPLNLNIAADTPREGGGDSNSRWRTPPSDSGSARVHVEPDDRNTPSDTPVFDATEPTYDEAALRRAIVYPESAQRMGIEGTVIIRVLIDRHGRAVKTLIDQSVRPDLDRAAADAVLKVVYTPAIQNGNPVPVWIQVPVVFRLH
ncbi:MAG TPA: energy transducer TonB [Candidatus Kapabacteria bacterium]|nr:energy transducer TonB [Candidatus Kapabacteria bacterium]